MARILVVDDNETVRRIVSRILEMAGHRVSEAGDGEQALSAMHRDAPDLVITDVDMPVMNGRELLRQARDRFPCVTVIGMSGDRAPDGFDAFIRKPFDIGELQAMVTRGVGRPRREAFPPLDALPI